MRIARSSKQRGQALIMVSLALVAMSGLVGLAVDFGWSFFVRRAAQSAADAAALGAANAAMDAVSSGSITMASLAGYSTSTSCSGGFADTRQSACLYARQNGFTAGGDGGRQDVLVAADTTSPAPTVPGVNVHYWVTVRITNSIPQLYSAVLGHANATIAARATAAIADSIVNGSVIALDRSATDGGPNGKVDLQLASDSKIWAAPNGIVLSSTLKPGAGTCTGCKGVVQTPYTLIRTGGSLDTGGATWTNGYTNTGDGPQFYDPMRNLGQPPLPSAGLTPTPVPGGNLNAYCGGTCAPGAYFATYGPGSACPNCASGAPLTVTSSLNFSGGSFGDFVFFGGLSVTSGTVNFGPGRYIMGGVSSSSSLDLNLSGGGTTIAGSGSDAGRVFILADPSYPGINTQVSQVNNWLSTNTASTCPTGCTGSSLPSLSFGSSNISANSININGLDPTKTLPTDTNAQGNQLSDFGPLLVWQDQAFSDLTYTPNGNIDLSCGNPLETACNQTPPATPVLQLGVLQGSKLNGVLYQPRGAFLQLLPNSSATVLQIVSGAVDMQKNSGLTMLPMPNPPKTRIVSLIE